MRTRTKRLFFRFGIAACVAVASPVAAAGLLQGVSVAGEKMSDTAPPADASKPAPKLSGNIVPVAARFATKPPRRLSFLAGDDDIAWSHVGEKPKTHRK